MLSNRPRPPSSVFPPTKATGFRKISTALIIETERGDTVVKAQDFPRLLSIMCESAGQDDLVAMHRVIARKRTTIHERSCSGYNQ